MKTREPKTIEEARQYAIDWQNWVSDEDTKLSYRELAEWQAEMESVALDWGLGEEFRENGII